MDDFSEKKISIKQWADDDKPREKMMLKGQVSLSDAELLAILIGSGTRDESAVDLCKRILQAVNHNLNELSKLSLSKLKQFKGIGDAKAITIMAAMELGRRRKAENTKPVKIQSSRDVYEYVSPMLEDLPHEEFWIVFLNNSNKIIKSAQLSKGGLTATIVDVRMLFHNALDCLATAIILVHNHPSGSLVPSEEDKRITRKIGDAGKVLDIRLLDHVIVGQNGYLSFADEGIL
ncbi:MAG TPA: DNA repair protein RadC [Flavobacterium sp.]|nr:DNA repair protein RadC [Flavobacterium sp.]